MKSDYQTVKSRHTDGHVSTAKKDAWHTSLFMGPVKLLIEPLIVQNY